MVVSSSKLGREKRVPRYFFNVTGCGEAVVDDEGEIHSCPTRAIETAVTVATELAQDPEHIGCYVIVADQGGAEIARVLVSVDLLPDGSRRWH